MPTHLTVQHITDKGVLRAYLRQDSALHAYALGDLVPFMWAKSTYHGAQTTDGALQGISLLWHGVEPPVLLLFGTEAAADILLQNTPAHVFHMLPETLLPAFQRHYTTSHIRPLWRMAVDTAYFSAVESVTATRQLEGADIAALQALYRHGDGGPRPEEINALSADILENGVFYSAFVAEELVSVAGSHVFAPEESIGIIGFVYTKPTARGQGFATATTSAVVGHMFAAGVETVALNVERTNAAAIHAYQKLGFKTHTKIVEGYASR
jgi:predicted GNAT family acetyltransferase